MSADADSADRNEEWDDDLFYRIRLVIKHPTANPDSITEILGLTPNLAWRVGEQRTTPAGTPLEGKYQESAWQHSFLVTNERFFFRGISSMVDVLEPHSDFVLDLVATGGSVDLIVDLPGSVNLGDSIQWRDLQRLAALKVALGLEVFPDWVLQGAETDAARRTWHDTELEDLSPIEAFDAMQQFLQAYWERGGSSSDDIAVLLSNIGRNVEDDLSPIDKAQWNDWLDAVTKVKKRAAERFESRGE